MWTVLSATLRSRQKVEFEEGRLSVSSRSDSWPSDSESIKYKKSVVYFFYLALRPNAGHGLLIYEVFYITHNDVPQSVGLLWTSDQLIAETSTHTTDKHPCPQWDSKPQSQQVSGRRPKP
jgi:hypothetical protein